MKVLFLSTDTKLFDPKSSVHERFKGFSLLAEEVHVVVARPQSRSTKYYLMPNVVIHPTTAKNSFFALIKSFFIAFRIMRRAKAGEWVISAQDPFEQGWVGLVLSRLLQIPLHIQLHTDMFSPLFSTNSFLDRLRVVFADPVLRRAQRIRVDALRMKESLVTHSKISSEKIDVLHIYIDVEKMLSHVPKRAVSGEYLLYVGRFEREKNVESIIQGFALASKRFPALQLVLLGSGALEKEYRSLAVSLGVHEKILFIPWSSDVASYMRYARALLLASRFEGFALVLIEALLNGCPIVTTDVGAVGGIIPKSLAHIFPHGDTQKMSEEIEFVVSHAQEERKRAEESRALLLERIPQTLSEYTQLFKESLEHTVQEKL